jgi:hypothetical protein
LKLCVPAISGANATVIGVGGTPGGPFTLLSSTNVAAPLGLWTPLTNQFDGFGAFNITNVITPSEPQRFFLLQTP